MNVSQKAQTVRAIVLPGAQGSSRFQFFLVLAYLFLEFGRPQSLIPGLGALHLPGVTVALLAITLLASGKLKLSDTQTKLFIGLLALMAVHIPLAANNFWAFQATREMLITFVAYLGIITFIDSFEKYKKMINLWLCVHVFLAIYGIIKGGRGIGGFLKDENDFALILNMIIPFSFFMAMETKNASKKILLLIVTGLFVICNVITFSRGGFVGLVAVGFYCWLRSPHKIASMFGVIILAGVMLFFAPDKYWDRIETIKQEAQDPTFGTGGSRIYSWKIAWKMFLEHPIIGVGPQNFPWNFESYESIEGFKGRLHGSRAAHSLYFTLLPELGIVGVIIFSSMLWGDWKGRKKLLEFGKIQNAAVLKKPGVEKVEHELSSDEVRKVHFLALALGGSLVGYFVSGTFISVFYYPSFWVLMAFGIALGKVVYKDLMNAGNKRVLNNASI